jgi:hypothetical protein
MSDVLTAIFAIVFTSACIADIFFLWRRESKKPRLDNRRYCTRCGTVAEPFYYSAGSGLVERFLFCLFIVPSIFYHFWRRSREDWGCPRCKSAEVIPLDSPIAQGQLPPAVSDDPVVAIGLHR